MAPAKGGNPSAAASASGSDGNRSPHSSSPREGSSFTGVSLGSF